MTKVMFSGFFHHSLRNRDLMHLQKYRYGSAAARLIHVKWTSLPFNRLPDDKSLDRSKLKQSADDNIKFHGNSRKFYKWVENTVGKGEIARYEQFLLFPQCFQMACFPGASKGVIVWKWVNAVGC